ncbi:MAG: hypothetical protein IKS07_00805 [Lachnospiraceae bacterium]|nr:hypothetical protein [Lachnospiraceae bacterium]
MNKNRIRMKMMAVFAALILCFSGCGASSKDAVGGTGAQESGASSSVTVPETPSPEAALQAAESMEEAADAIQGALQETEGAQEESEPEPPVIDVIPESYACTIRVSINPSVLLYLDSKEQVIGIVHENEDAVEAFGEETIVGQSLEKAMDDLIRISDEKGYLKEDATVSITLEDVGEGGSVTDDTVLRNARDLAKAFLESLESTCNVSTEISETVQNDYHIEKTMITCPDCLGSGIFCPGDTDPAAKDVRYGSCHGTGVVTCLNPICNGGKCTRCGGTGRSTCFGCNGTGVNSVDGATCNHCGGSGTERCEYCHGTGNCERCNGTGQIHCLFADQHTTCETCGVTGQVEM